MRKTILLILLIASAVINAKAENVFFAGYCNGKLAESAELYFSGEKEVKLAIRLDDSMSKRLIGNDITSINVGLLSKLKLQSVDVWISTALESEPVIIKNVEKADLITGWNEIMLDNPYRLTGEQIYIGYTLHQTGQCMAISTYKDLPSKSLIIKDGDSDWTDYSDKGYGALGLEAQVTGETIPRYDFYISDIEVAESEVKSGAPAYIKCTLYNNGVQTVENTIITCESDNIGTFQYSIDKAIEYRSEEDVYFKIHMPPSNTDKATLNLRFEITSLDGNKDETPDDSYAETELSLFDNKFERCSLVEEFSTETCGNCPRVAGYMADALSTYDKVNRIIPVVHHSGFVYDMFTIEASKEYEKFYSSGTYAPMVMFDRYQFNGLVETIPSSPTDFINYFDAVLERETYVDINLDANVEDNMLKLRVFGDIAEGFDYENPRLTVFITEDNVPAVNQAGENGVIKGYIHQHVIRTVSDVWGEPLNLIGSNYSNEISVSVNSEEWNMNNLSVIAFISEYVEDDYQNRQVINAMTMPYLFTTAAPLNESDVAENIIDTSHNVKICIKDSDIIVNGDYDKMSVYSLDGICQNATNLSSGIYIVRIFLQNGLTQTHKIVIK